MVNYAVFEQNNLGLFKDMEISLIQYFNTLIMLCMLAVKKF